MTIVSIYNSRRHEISKNLLSTLFQQLPEPVILTGDFTSYNQYRGNQVNDNRGDKVLNFINQNQLKILSDGRHTRTSGTSKPTIALTIASPSLHPILSWSVTDSPLCGDHCTITVNIQSKNSEVQTTTTKFNINKANWHL